MFSVDRFQVCNAAQHQLQQALDQEKHRWDYLRAMAYSLNNEDS